MSMSNSSIHIRQNSPESIEQLRAQRSCYNIVEKMYVWRMIISIFLPIFSVSMYFLFDNSLSNFVLILAGIGLLVCLILESYEQTYSVKGAKIQEMFDTHVFQINWNTALLGDKVSLEDIHLLAQKDKTPDSELANWYTGLVSDDERINILTAQRMNLSWTHRQKHKFKWVLILTFSIILISSIVIGCLMKLSLITFLITFIFPSLSLYIYLLKNFIEIHNQGKELQRVILLIEQYIENGSPKKSDLRSIQDAVYIYGRIPNHIVPNFIYKLLRPKYESSFEKTNKKLTTNK